MAQSQLGDKLKQARINAGYKVQEVSDILINEGFERTSVKTIYSWEGGNSQPTPDCFLRLCDLYNIKDILLEFGYSKRETKTIYEYQQESNRLIEIYDDLNAVGKEKLIEYAEDIATLQKYKKYSDSEKLG